MNAQTSRKLNSLNTKKDSESSRSTSNHSNSRKVESSKMTGRKRKFCSSPEPPTKRQRGSEVAVEAEMQRGTKRRASGPTESPKKKKRQCSNTTDVSDATEVIVEVATARGTKTKDCLERESSKRRRKNDTSTKNGESTEDSADTVHKMVSSDDKLSETETSSSSSSESSSDSSPSSCGPSSSKQDKDSTTPYNRSIRNFQAKYVQLFKLGEGGYGSVYAGYRKADVLPVAIKHIPREDVKTRPMEINGKTYLVPIEVILMIRAAGGPETIGKSAAVTLLDWFDLEQEGILVMERPMPAEDLYDYLYEKTGPMEEVLAKNIMKQLVEAAIKMHSQGVFHRDIKLENILIETSHVVPRVRLIDFGCGCFLENGPYHEFSGTLGYAPPEYFLQKRYKAGPTTVWQLGALLYELLKGDCKFTTSRFLDDKTTFFQDLRELHVSKDCFNFFQICMTKDPKKRATLEEMQQHPWFK